MTEEIEMAVQMSEVVVEKPLAHATITDVSVTSSSQAPRPSLVETGRAVIQKSVSVPKSVSGFNTDDNEADNFFHFLLYSDTNMHKTSIAAEFGDPKETLIVLTRSKEQVKIPLRGKAYEVLHAPDGSAVRYALQNPEHWWAQRQAANPALGELKYLLLDDATEAVNFLVEEGDSADNRKNYRDAGSDLRLLMKLLRAKKIHLGMIALARFKENAVTNKDRVGPDLPPSMMGMIGAEFEYCFYVEPETYNLVTDREWTSFTEEVEGKTKTYKVEVFAKSKIPNLLVGRVPPVIAKKEKRSLKEIWNAIQTASNEGAPTKPAVSRVAPSTPFVRRPIK